MLCAACRGAKKQIQPTFSTTMHVPQHNLSLVRNTLPGHREEDFSSGFLAALDPDGWL